MAPAARRDPLVFVSDFFDCSIYVDAAEHDARHWYIERFLLLRATAFKESASYFHRYAALSDEAAEQVAGEIWDAINGPNLRENILPTRERAHLVLVKGADHARCASSSTAGWWQVGQHDFQSLHDVGSVPVASQGSARSVDNDWRFCPRCGASSP
jgi:hypothetical protein